MKERPHLKSFRDWVRQIIFGMCIGASDLVPGISGGTMALILGIYEDLIFSIRSLGTKPAFSLFRLRFQEFSKGVSWDFIIGLLIGVCCSFYLLSQIIQKALSDPVQHGYLYSLFLGMLAASSVICAIRLQWKPGYIALFCLGSIATFLLTGPAEAPKSQDVVYHVRIPIQNLGAAGSLPLMNYDPEGQWLLGISKTNLAALLAKGDISHETEVYEQKTKTIGIASDFVTSSRPPIFNPWLIFCGAIGISAMMLPGISGSYLLNVLGAYSLVISSLADFLNGGDLDAFIVLFNVGIGIIIGALLFSKVVAYLFKRYHDQTLVLLVGFMTGSFLTVWPFYSYEYYLNPLKLSKGAELVLLKPYFPSLSNPELFPYLATSLLGFLGVIVLERISNKKKRVAEHSHDL